MLHYNLVIGDKSQPSLMGWQKINKNTFFSDNNFELISNSSRDSGNKACMPGDTTELFTILCRSEQRIKTNVS